MFLIVGLGNPDKKYEKTRHNIGFDVIDALAERYRMIERVRVLLAKPQTYMNLSGDSVSELLRFYKLDPESELLVIFDDISLNPGCIRIRKKGSAGGHNGIKSIIAQIGTQDFMRIKVGVGEKPEGWDLADHVLGRFLPEDRKKAEEAISDAADAAVWMIQGRTDDAMNEYNGKNRSGK